MSVRTWKKEFYPIEAESAVLKDPGIEELIKHSLKKWIGLRPANLLKHEVMWVEATRIIDMRVDETSDFTFRINADSCTLCLEYGITAFSDGTSNFYKYHQRKDGSCKACEPCILFKIRGVSCDTKLTEEQMSPVHRATILHDPEPMIQLLEKALKRITGVKYI